MAEGAVVARERELARLAAALERALAGTTELIWIIGEAGAGKTTLVAEFVRRAAEADPALVVALGTCDAQTGDGDPYLPFRQVLALLTGAGDGPRADPAGGARNSNRLKNLVRVTGATLLDIGPSLINNFVPGSMLVAKAATVAAGQLGLTDVFRRPTKEAGKEKDREKEKDKAPAPTLDQDKIFQQYSAVLETVTRQAPLVLVLDDLQWADSASIGLLFHLTRRLTTSRLLIVGTYRPDDVAIGRGGARHPLEPVLHEIQRYAGDVAIDLGQARAREGRAFVDALLDREPNALDTAFRQALYTHTGGHPLFTVELLRALEERGDLARDADGRLGPGAGLNWSRLPARVEGVIAERIGRLPEELRDVLSIASVEGEEFTTAVLAQVLGWPERPLLQRLARELARKHRLVEEAGAVQAGGHLLTRYRFTHAPIGQYLYADLSAGERRLLHR
ncbi:MAG TPA: AAA family ATPase, partial [Chloroflexia bacterium]|nr:AAA family ATPase [Chloroflexia bacterium]